MASSSHPLATILLLICCHLPALFAIDQIALNCREARNCSECISIHDQCSWCTDADFAANKPRCQSRFLPNECGSQADPRHEKRTQMNDNFSSDPRKPIQLKPQRIRVTGRVGFTSDVLVEYKQAADYPMDLYYLMDMSYTMLPYKRSVSRVGKLLAEKMKTTTKDFRIGFGTFVDKETIPFANYDRETREVTNRREKVSIEYTHSFINHMRLSKNDSEFERKVIGAKVSGNLDSPEGTLDALMQVMVCEEEIGWRPQSDKIIVVATDEEFHYAGDGKIGGIIIPNDGQCHLENNRYVASTIYDYPSMQHIAEIAQKRKFNIVFSVARNKTALYQVLTDIIGSNARVSQFTERFSQKDDSIASMIEEVYKNISTSVEIVVEDKPDNVDIRILSNCGQSDQPPTPTSICGFQGKAIIPFQVRITLKECTKPGVNTEHTIRIELLNKDEAVEIAFREICQCDCELKGQPNSPRCSTNGTFSCGICTTCNGKRSGKECECDPEKPIDPRNPHAHCIKAGETKQCSGHGQCECGKCKCDLKWTGDYCQIDESACYHTVNGRLVKCNNQGECKNNQCECNERYEGKHCDCIKSDEECKDASGVVCSDRGDCRCGRCECKKRATAHGRYCEKCPLCDAPQYCEQILSCVEDFSSKFCYKTPSSLGVWIQGLNSNISTLPSEPDVALARLSASPNDTNPCSIEPEDCPAIVDRWTSWQIIDAEVFDAKPSDDDVAESSTALLSSQEQNFFNYQCLKVINGCDVSYNFRLIYEPEKPFDLRASESQLERDEKEILHLKISPFKEICPQPVNMVVVGSSAFFTVLLLGMLTICIWKILTEYLDRREYERFMMEVDAANFAETENPLYKDVKVQFRNPAFGLRDRTSRFFQNLKR